MKSKGIIILITTILLIIAMAITMFLCLFLRPISFNVECESINVTYIKEYKKYDGASLPEFVPNKLTEEGKKRLSEVLGKYTYSKIMFSKEAKMPFEEGKRYDTVIIDMYNEKQIVKTYEISNTGTVIVTKYEEENVIKQSFYKLKLDEEQMNTFIKELYSANF